MKSDWGRHIKERIEHYSTQLALIETAYAEEQAKPIKQRQRENLIFLNKERSVYTFAVGEMKSILELIQNGDEQ